MNKIHIYTSSTRFIAGIFAGLSVKENNGLAKRGGRPGFNAIEGQSPATTNNGPSRQSRVIAARAKAPCPAVYRLGPAKLASVSPTTSGASTKSSLRRDARGKPMFRTKRSFSSALSTCQPGSHSPGASQGSSKRRCNRSTRTGSRRSSSSAWLASSGDSRPRIGRCPAQCVELSTPSKSRKSIFGHPPAD